jgi:hypothetical protein
MGLRDKRGSGERTDPARARFASDFGRLLGPGEQLHETYPLLRDLLFFTNRRLLLVDSGLSGRKTTYRSVPYRSIAHFAVETVTPFDADAELKIWLTGDEVPIARQFGADVDVYEVQAVLAQRIALAG